MGRIHKEKIMLIESLNKRILSEGKPDLNNLNKCKKCIGTYSGLLDKCGFYAIERFEENYGNAQGGSMGDDYFETDGEYKSFDAIISRRVQNYIPTGWNSMNPKFKMQIWSFMYNSDSNPQFDRFRWLAILYLTARKDITEFNEAETKKIIDAKGSDDWFKAINLVNSTNSWSYSKLLKMIDGQYRTYNPNKYASTWSYRPETLDRMYTECINGIDPPLKQSDNFLDTFDTDSMIQGAKDTFNKYKNEFGDFLNRFKTKDDIKPQPPKDKKPDSKVDSDIEAFDCIGDCDDIKPFVP